MFDLLSKFLTSEYFQALKRHLQNTISVCSSVRTRSTCFRLVESVTPLINHCVHLLVGWLVRASRRRSVCHDFLKSQGSSTSKFLSGRLFRKGQFQNGERWRPPSPPGLLQNTTPYNKVLTLGMKRF